MIDADVRLEPVLRHRDPAVHVVIWNHDPRVTDLNTNCEKYLSKLFEKKKGVLRKCRHISPSGVGGSRTLCKIVPKT